MCGTDEAKVLKLDGVVNVKCPFINFGPRPIFGMGEARHSKPMC